MPYHGSADWEVLWPTKVRVLLCWGPWRSGYCECGTWSRIAGAFAGPASLTAVWTGIAAASPLMRIEAAEEVYVVYGVCPPTLSHRSCSGAATAGGGAC